MIRTINDTVVAFDCEWIPDASAARLLDPTMVDRPEAECLQTLWARNGATEEDPHPFVRLMQSRVVSIAMMMRTAPKAPGGTPELRLAWLPKLPNDPASRSERKVIGGFLAAVGNRQPQLVGFNSRSSDLRILAQRAITLGIPAPTFFNKPEKPWSGTDYFGRDSEMSIDLMELIAGNVWGRSSVVSLHEAATLCGIPGKFDAHGSAVFDLWQQGRFEEIVHYNCFDAITTYLLWLRLAWLSGRFTTDDYENEQAILRDYLMGLCDQPDTAFLEDYLTEWDRISAIKEALAQHH